MDPSGLENTFPLDTVTTILTADGSHTLHSERYGETFHSVNGAVTESRHVFLNASGVADRLAAGKHTRVLEVGFGLGLNCLLSADLASDRKASLDYHAIENDISVLSLISRVHYREQLNHPELYDQLLSTLESISTLETISSLASIPMLQTINTLASTPTLQTFSTLDSISTSGSISAEPESQDTASRSVVSALGENINLTLHLCDAIKDDLPEGQFDAIYLDAFSPDNNPECWSEEFFSRLRQQTASGGALTTYSAKGSVRRALMAAGFNVKKLAGPPGKREMLHAGG